MSALQTLELSAGMPFRAAIAKYSSEFCFHVHDKTLGAPNAVINQFALHVQDALTNDANAVHFNIPQDYRNILTIYPKIQPNIDHITEKIYLMK